MKGGCAATRVAVDNSITATDAPSRVRATMDRIEGAQQRFAGVRRQRAKPIPIVARRSPS